MAYREVTRVDIQEIIRCWQAADRHLCRLQRQAGKGHGPGGLLRLL